MTSNSRFERVLPPEVRTQLTYRKQFRPLKALWPAPLAWLIAGAALIVALIATLPQPKPGSAPATAAPASQPTPQSSLPPVSIPRTAAIPRPALPVQLRTPAPRAQLVRLPTQPIPLPVGAHLDLTMPDGSLVSATFRGYLENASQLPIHGGQEGDMYVIGRDTWVLTTPASLNRMTWVDP